VLRHARVRTIALRDSSGQISEFHGTLVDTTDQIEIAQRFAQIGKTEAVARLAGGIAHDFNNLLTVIGANVELWGEATGAHAEIVDTRRAVQSARALTDRLLALGRKAPLSRQVVYPNELVTRTVELLRRVIGDHVQLVLALAPELEAICVDPAWIEHALINLVINARDAMPGGGTVRVETHRAPDGVRGPEVVIDVSDDGPGMGPEIKSRIFEPFFTTKGEGGTGLGLPTVLATIEQHGGSVEVESELGAGTRFRLRLPAQPGLRPKSLVPEAEPPGLEATCREILVVEDEPLVAAVIARSLEREGHTPLLAHRPSDALKLWSEHPDVGLLICDVSLAEMRGPELVRVLRGTGRDFRVLYVTGFDEEGAGDTEGERVLTKPFGPRDLLRALAEF
jgi:two-component system cell cycle sensor histidine kinase/response regulator CckA